MANNDEVGPSDWTKPFVNMAPFDPKILWKDMQRKKARKEAARKEKEEKDAERERNEQMKREQWAYEAAQRKKREDDRKAAHAKYVKAWKDCWEAYAREKAEAELPDTEAAQEDMNETYEFPCMTQPSERRPWVDIAPEEEEREKPSKFPRTTQ
jgi:hypothetical protein